MDAYNADYNVITGCVSVVHVWELQISWSIINEARPKRNKCRRDNKKEICGCECQSGRLVGANNWPHAFVGIQWENSDTPNDDTCTAHSAYCQKLCGRTEHNAVESSDAHKPQTNKTKITKTTFYRWSKNGMPILHVIRTTAALNVQQIFGVLDNYSCYSPVACVRACGVGVWLSMFVCSMCEWERHFTHLRRTY